MKRLEFAAWLMPWVFFLLAACGLGLVASESVGVVVTG